MINAASIEVKWTDDSSAPYTEHSLEVNICGSVVGVHGQLAYMPPNAARALAAALREMATQAEAHAARKVKS